MIESTKDSVTPHTAAPRLRRQLTLWNLVVYGIVIIQPTAPMGIYGVVSNVARGHVVSTVLLAMVAMLFTAISYGRMARVYPSAGSAYTYVGRELHPAAGYMVGWSMLMDYLLNPIICAIWCAAALRNIVPDVPYAAWVVAIVATFTALNLLGVQASGRVNSLLAIAMGIVVVVFLGYAVRYLAMVARPAGAEWLRPFYDPATFQPGSFFRGTSIAVLTYIGFDGISTMSEEVENPRRNIMLATVLTCFVIGVLSALEVYVAQLVSPYRGGYPEDVVDTAYVYVARQIGGAWLFHVLNATLLVANLGSGIAAQFGSARLLYSMGRSNALPKRFFAALDVRSAIPRNNVLLVGACTLVGVFFLTYGKGAELLNFGAFVAFMGVNLAALVHYRFRSEERVPGALAIPLAGFLVSAFIWMNLGQSALALGFTWLTLGALVYWSRRRARVGPQMEESL